VHPAMKGVGWFFGGENENEEERGRRRKKEKGW
jgi:hypothetical protein